MKLLLPPILFTIVGLLVLLLSYFIKYKKMASLISGYNEDQVIDKDGFCNWIGGVFIWFGFYTIFTALLLWMLPVYVMYIVIAFGTADIAAVAIAIVGGKKYKKKS